MYLSRSRCLPVKLTLSQFVWAMEILVGAAVFSGILGKRFFVAGTTVEFLIGLSFFALAVALFCARLSGQALDRAILSCHDTPGSDRRRDQHLSPWRAVHLSVSRHHNTGGSVHSGHHGAVAGARSRPR